MSCTRQANHHRVKPAGDSAGQRHNRVFERHKIGYSTVEFNVQPATLGSSYVSQLDNATSAVRNGGIRVQYGAGLENVTRPKENGRCSRPATLPSPSARGSGTSGS